MATNGQSMASAGDSFYGSASPASSDLPKTQSNNPPGHRRTYQACIPCRRRKVRCDLGEVDNPHEPPCNRCRRESKECFFSATRRKKKTSNGEETQGVDAETIYDELHTSRKRQRLSAPSYENALEEEDEYEEPPRTPGGSYGRSQPLRRPTQTKPVQYGEEDVKASEMTAAILQNHEVHGGHDALKLLFVAANQMRTRTPSSGTMARPNPKGLTPASNPSTISPILEKAGTSSYTSGPMDMFQTDGMWKAEIGPEVSNDSTTGGIPVHLTSGYAAALKAWSRFRFVRAGWLTAKEAIDYILYFYKYLAPLTPIVLPNFRQPESHQRLLEEEPMLAVTMLLIASRHMKLPGPGSLSRPYSLHDKFYKYLDGMIKRVVWGQEQFGGGFCGAGAGAGGMPGCDVNPLTRKGLRTMGTVESLLLLTEWHPRAMHFPPEEDDDELMVPDEPAAAPDLAETTDVLKGIGGHRMDAWLEPCWRSDRMCWMLTGMAMSLAFEIGVFDKTEWQRHARAIDGQPLSAKELAIYDQRRNNVKDVLLIYTTLTSGRIGLTSMLPSNYSKPEDSDLYDIEALSSKASIAQVTLHFWLRIAAIMRDGNSEIFRNKEFTRALIRTGKYKEVLGRLQPPIQRWRQQFDQCKVIPQFMRYILEIEYEYARVYLNAIALQAVVERCAKYPGNASTSVVEPTLREAASGIGSNATISPATLAKMIEGDRKNVLAVSDSARNLLKIIVEGLAPNEFLRHAPVRTYFRIISTAIVLLKTFSLGATESDVADSLTLMDRTISALRNCVVDDVHVASRFADLLDVATRNVKPRLVRIAADGRASRSRRPSTQVTRSHTPNAEYSTAGADNQTMAQGTAGMSSNQNGWRGNSSLMSPPTTVANSHPLYGIPDELYDLTSADNPYAVMPPPGFFNSPDSTNMSVNEPVVTGAGRDQSYGSYASTGNFMDQQDWLTLPLDSLLNLQGAEVEQSLFGPTFGSQGDMLEVMLHEQTGPNGFSNTNSGFGSNLNGYN